MNDISSLPSHLSATVISLIGSLCRHDVYDYFTPRSCGVDCVVTLTDEGFLVYEDFSCIYDCLCFGRLYADFDIAGGVCSGSYADVELGWPVSTQSCQMSGTNVMEGLCRPGTIADFIQPTCLNRVWSLSINQRDEIRNLIRSLCQQDLYDYFSPRPFPACEQDCFNVGLLTDPPHPSDITAAQVSSGALIYQNISCVSDCPVQETDCL